MLKKETPYADLGVRHQLHTLASEASARGDAKAHALIHAIEMSVNDVVHACLGAQRLLNGEPLEFVRRVLATITTQTTGA